MYFTIDEKNVRFVDQRLNEYTRGAIKQMNALVSQIRKFRATSKQQQALFSFIRTPTHTAHPVHTYIHEQTHARKHTHTHANTHTHTHTHTHTRTLIHALTHTHTKA